MKEDLFSLREGAIFQTLKALAGRDFVVIGGYAVNAYARPRFSVDCDIVVRDNNELKKIGETLVKKGYRKEEPAEAQYAAGFSRYEKRLENGFAVSIDILVQSVKDRMTGTEFEAGWVFKNAEMRALKGKTVAEELNVRIIGIDALLVMKIIAGRATDMRDVFMMMPNAKDMEWIKAEIEKRCNYRERIERIIAKVTAEQFRNSLAGVYGRVDQKVFEKHRKALVAFMAAGT